MHFIFYSTPVIADSTKPLTKFAIGLIIQKHEFQLADLSDEYDLINTSVKLAIEKLNRSSDSNNIEIQAQIFQYEKDHISVIPAIQEALKSNVIGLLGASPSHVALLAAKEIAGKGIVLIPPTASANSLAVDFPSVLMMNGRADTGALVTGVILDSMLKVKKFLAPVSWERTVARNSWEGLPENIRNKGELLKLYEPKLDLVNFRKKLLSEKYDAIYSPNFPGITAQLIHAASIDGHRIPFVGNAAWGENTGGSFHQLTKGLTFRGIFARQFSIWEPSRELKKFRDLIESRTKDPFSSTAVLYYDATLFLGKEIRKCGSKCTRQQLMNYLSKDPNHIGIFGEYIFDKRGSNGIDASFNILEVDGSGFKYIKQIKLNSATKP